MENDMETDRLCFVFLPYKVSMWDSMETVWKAADKDPDCDAYVVPIPYFDKDQDGNLTVEHYEGDQYHKMFLSQITAHSAWKIKNRMRCLSTIPMTRTID